METPYPKTVQLQPELPHSTCQQIQKLEQQIEQEQGQVSREVVICLLQLYTEAVEFYEGLGDHRWRDWTDKIRGLLGRDGVREVFRSRDSEKQKEDISRDNCCISSSQLKQIINNSQSPKQKSQSCRKSEQDIKKQKEEELKAKAQVKRMRQSLHKIYELVQSSIDNKLQKLITSPQHKPVPKFHKYRGHQRQ